MSIKGTPVFDTLKIVTIDINFHQKTMNATAAFVKDGETFGWTDGKGLNWSKATKAAAAELAKAMENDLAKIHFGKSGAEERKPGLDMPTGIAEHVEGDDTPSV
jgi:hypothetical protein